MKNICELSRRKNVIVISHRLENVVPADRIYYMEDGRIAECGSHEELMESGGGYAKLYRAQKALENGYKEADAQ